MTTVQFRKDSGQFTKAFSLGKALFFVAIAIVILVATFTFASRLPDMGVEKTTTPITLDAWYGKIPGFILGINGTTTLEAFIIALMIFLILFVAISDILQMFSTFSTPVAWVIGFGLAAIAGIGGAVKIIAQILGVTAGVGALGIALIIIGSLVSAVTLNLGIGGWTRKWRLMRQIEVEEMKSTKGGAKVGNAIRALKQTAKEYEEGEAV